MNLTRSTFARACLAATITAVAAPVAAGCTNAPPPPTAVAARLQVVLDYSPTLSDAGALLYLASNPVVDLLAVTLPGTGEADCEPGTRTTRSLLTIAGRPAVPVGCGSNEPLAGHRDWPDEWRAEVNRWGAEMLPAVPHAPVADAVQLLAQTLAAATSPITIVAVGPLTNIALVLAAHPEYTSRVARIVIMGGAVLVAGNVEAAPTAEWNLYIDPQAAREVIASGIAVTFVPLDATNHVPWSERLLSRLGTLTGPAARTVHQMAASRATLAGFYLWDELAALAAVEPGLVTVETMTVTIDDDGAITRDPSGERVDVAIDADAEPVIEEFLRVLNGGSVPDADVLTPAERVYLVAMNAADGRANIDLNNAYRHVDSAGADDRQAISMFIVEFIGAVASLADDLRSLAPPASLTDAHARYLDALVTVVAGKGALLDALAGATGDNLDAVINDAFDESGLADAFAEVTHACQALEDYSFARSGPRPCSAAADR